MIWMFLFSRLVFGQDLSIQEYCFDSNNRLSEVYNRMKIVLVPADRISLVENCLNIQSPAHRSELIEKYLNSFAPDARKSFSSTTSLKNHCDIEIEKIINEKAVNQNIGINQNSINLEAVNKNNQRTETSQIKTIDFFEFSYDLKQIKGKCRYISSDHYEIELEVVNIQLPPTVVYGNSSFRPTQHPSSDIQTKVTVQLRRGEKLEVAQILKNSKDENTSANSNSNLEFKEDDKVKSQTVFLTIK